MVKRNEEYHRYLWSQNWRLRVLRKLATNKGLTNFQRLWMLTRERTLRNFQFICDDCGKRRTKRNIDVHHNTYARIFHEEPDDLAVLCKTCHKLRHGLSDMAGLLEMLGELRAELTHLRAHIRDDYDQYNSYHPYAAELRKMYPWLEAAKSEGDSDAD